RISDPEKQQKVPRCAMLDASEHARILVRVSASRTSIQDFERFRPGKSKIAIRPPPTNGSTYSAIYRLPPARIDSTANIQQK
ncbi:unnamed protein product, partial [Nesidiocoris tenuis]